MATRTRSIPVASAGDRLIGDISKKSGIPKGCRLFYIKLVACQDGLFGGVYRHFTEILEKFAQFERSLACARAGSLVPFFELEVRVRGEKLNLFADLIDKIFHDAKKY